MVRGRKDERILGKVRLKIEREGRDGERKER